MKAKEARQAMAEAIKAGARGNNRRAKAMSGQVLMVKLDDKSLQSWVICDLRDADFIKMKIRSDLVIDLAANKMLKNRYADTGPVKPAIDKLEHWCRKRLAQGE